MQTRLTFKTLSRLLLAVELGAFVGIEREIACRPVG
jgi:uncharacterized membrane protein YhiD involved in acid resistance